jgi:quercetin dioxygenase-like cupin family protein
MVIKPNERQDIHFPELKSNHLKLQLLVSDVMNRRMEPYLLTMKEGAIINGHFYTHKGDEFTFIMEGELEVEIQEEKQLLREGDSLYIESTFPSRWSNVGKGNATLLWVLSPPGGGRSFK